FGSEPRRLDSIQKAAEAARRADDQIQNFSDQGCCVRSQAELAGEFCNKCIQDRHNQSLRSKPEASTYANFLGHYKRCPKRGSKRLPHQSVLGVTGGSPGDPRRLNGRSDRLSDRRAPPHPGRPDQLILEAAATEPVP